MKILTSLRLFEANNSVLIWINRTASITNC